MESFNSLTRSLKFMADAMLGHLARYLRLMGFDTASPSNDWPDEVVLEETLRDGRILLTRDREFCNGARKRIETYFQKDQKGKDRRGQQSQKDKDLHSEGIPSSAIGVVFISSQDTTEQLAEFFVNLAEKHGLDLDAFESDVKDFYTSLKKEKSSFRSQKHRLGGDIMPLFPSRCTKCNGRLILVKKSDVRYEVPPMALEHHVRFWRCENPTCGGIYWVGTAHWEHITEFILKSLEIAKRRR